MHIGECVRYSMHWPWPIARPRFLPWTPEYHAMARLSVEWWLMTGKVSVVIEQDEHGCYAWCPELKGCQSQGTTVENALTNIREAIELYMETLTDEERLLALSREILTTAVEVHA